MNNEELAKAITKALGYAENGGEPTPQNLRAGKTGEMKSIFQFTPDTWKNYSKQVFGQDTPLTPANETWVVNKKVKEWLDKGFNTEQIASMWNAGEGKPNAHKENWKGVNKKYGVAFDTPAYAKKVKSYTDKFIKEGSGTQQPIQTMSGTTQQPQTTQQPIASQFNPMKDIMAKVYEKTSTPQNTQDVGGKVRGIIQQLIKRNA